MEERLYSVSGTQISPSQAVIQREPPANFPAILAVQFELMEPELAKEDQVIGAYKLNIKPENVTITPVEQVFAQ